MKKKIVGIFVCMLMFTTVLSVAAPVDKKVMEVTPASLSLAKNLGKNNIAQKITTLISEPFNNRTVEVDLNGTILWEKNGLSMPAEADRLMNGNTLISEVGSAQVIEVNQGGAIVWNYSVLGGPFDADRLTNGNTLIADTYGFRVIEVNTSGMVVWEKTNLNIPTDLQRLENGNTLITEALEYRVIEVDAAGTIQWIYQGTNALYGAERLANGNTLISDTLNNRIIEVDNGGTIVWEIDGLYQPTHAERLTNGNTLIAQFFNNTVKEVDMTGAVVWELTGFNAFDAERIQPVFHVTIKKGFGITATIENIGNANASNVEVTITVTGGFVLLNKAKVVSVGDIAIGDSGKARCFPIGIGKITIEAKVTCGEESEGYGNASGFLVLFFII